MANRKQIKVLVIDDSAYNRRAFAEFLEAERDITVVGKACDGDEGLQIAFSEEPDVITLDLEMPRMDGFTFLRILMAKKPTPVIVISSHAQKEKVFRALELGALDFVAKPSHRISPVIKEIKDEVIKKVRLAKTLGPESLHPFAPYGEIQDSPYTIETEMPSSPFACEGNEAPLTTPRRSSIPVGGKIAELTRKRPSFAEVPAAAEGSPRRIVALAASTGGPGALTQILTEIPADIDAGILVVQHMPPRFTTTFAERLDKQCNIAVKEVTGTDIIKKGEAYLAPGHACMEVRASDDGLCVMAVPPTSEDRYVPSADRLIKSLATVGSNALAVVLTGMGDDGSSGVMELAAAGGTIVAEDESTAVVFGMPGAAIKTGKVNYVVKLEQMIQVIRNFVLL